jgi:hypothetical protein
LVGRPATASTATGAPVGPSTLFGDQVLGDFGFVEILVIADGSQRRGRRRRSPELRIPDGAERGRAWRTARRHDLLFRLLGLATGTRRAKLSGSFRVGSFRGLALDLVRSSAATAATSAASSASPPRLAFVAFEVDRPRRFAGTRARLGHLIEGEHLGCRQVRFGQSSGDA